jgi:alpha-D-ribose 1-methylphosphonate 5-triphosphate synthase subunit PhnH
MSLTVRAIRSVAYLAIAGLSKEPTQWVETAPRVFRFVMRALARQGTLTTCKQSFEAIRHLREE